MPLSLALVVRPGRAAAAAAVAAVLALLHGAIVLRWPDSSGSHAAGIAGRVLLVLVLAATMRAAGVLAPFEGRRARVGLHATRAGIALLLVVALVGLGSGGVRVSGLAVAGLVAAAAGLRLLSRRRQELPAWAHGAVLAGLTLAVALPAGGSVALGVAWLAVAAAIHGAAEAYERLALPASR